MHGCMGLGVRSWVHGLLGCLGAWVHEIGLGCMGLGLGAWDWMHGLGHKCMGLGDGFGHDTVLG